MYDPEGKRKIWIKKKKAQQMDKWNYGNDKDHPERLWRMWRGDGQEKNPGNINIYQHLKDS